VKEFNRPISGLKQSVFSSISAKASKLGAINLGQGFPDYLGPEWFQKLVSDAFLLKSNPLHQYANPRGNQKLREELASFWHSYYDLDYCAETEISIFNGASEALYSSLRALLNPGDEVITFEPFFDLYSGCVEMTGARLVPVTLHAPTFHFDEKQLQQAFNSKTKLVIINTPHNPTGKVFSKAELEMIAEQCLKWDCYVISDEVYQFLTFDQWKHQSIASIAGMKERTLCISSIAKTFGFTGWKLGWIMTTPELTNLVSQVHQYISFSVCHPLQEATAGAIDRLSTYIPDFQASYQEKRDFFLAGLKQIGFSPFDTQGSFFVYCAIPSKLDDWQYAEELLEKKAVAVIPASPFYLQSEEGKRHIRFCFAKEKNTLEKALQALGS
jgi:aspartate/methionine/tyrosine aminotransferase